MAIPLSFIAVKPENIGELWGRCRGFCFVDLDDELWLLRLDFLIGFKRYGWDRGRLAAYLLPGRECWGLPELPPSLSPVRSYEAYAL